MEIYLLREEQQIGPYGPDDLRTWLHDGNVLPTELAWVKGMEDWVPLQNILEPEPEPEAKPMVQRPILKPLPKASAKQKAFLSYMGASFTANLNEEQANHLVTQVSKDRKLAARMARWENDRLDLHPDMYKEEIEARRANRPAYFHKLVQTEGGDCFNGVTKAHCQVLVTYLDVNHPRWDANLTDAAWHYFFPAINEKFPQLVNKEWRPKLKYKEGPKVAAELLEKEEGEGRGFGHIPVGKILRRTVTVMILVGLVGAGVYGWQHPEKIPASVKDKLAEARDQAGAIIRGDDPAPVKKAPVKKVAGAPADAAGEALKPATAETTDAGPKAPPETPEAAPKAATGDMAAMKPADGDMAAMKPADPTMAVPVEAKPEAVPMAPAEQPKPTEQLFNPNANAPTPPVAATAPGAPPMSGAPRNEAKVIRPIQIPSKYGVVTIPVGTNLKVLAHDGEWVTLSYVGQALRVPASSTDYVATQ